ncbi:hypothetical protein B0H21DRAFT_59553 [Amylocystis lapponica]|nr:hypothetical protein B0H21DRAFT_59553 [Amylocystis lapponica]
MLPKQHLLARQIPQLPPELLDRIIDFLYDDPAGLKACSITCRTCVPRTRFHLFHTTSLIGLRDDFTRFAQLLASSPALGLYVRTLSVTFLPKFDYSLFSDITMHLGNVRSLTLVGVDIYVDKMLLSRIGIVEHLAMWASFRTSADVCALFHAFPHVSNLHVGSLAYPESDLMHELTPSLPTVPLRRIRVDKGCTPLLQEMLTHPLPLLEDLQISLRSVDYLEAFHDAVIANGHLLKRLAIQVWYCGPESNQRQNALLCESFAHCTVLESVQFVCPAGVSWVATALSASNSPLKEIVVDGFARDSAELDLLAAALREPCLRDARKVVLKLRQFSLVSASVANLSGDAIRSRFSVLFSHGVVSIIV